MASPNSQMTDNGNTTPTPTQTNNTLMSYGGVTSSSSTIFTTTMPEIDIQEEVKPIKKTLNLEEIEKLPYEIHRYSSFSTNYVPE